MNKEFDYMNHLFAAGAMDLEPTTPPDKIKWDSVISYAISQSTYYTCFVSIKKLALKKLVSDELFKNWEKDLFYAASINLIKEASVIHTINMLKNAGIKVVLLKGYLLSTNYTFPEYRISSDTDLLIDRKDESKALELMKNNGYYFKPRHAKGHHTHCYSERSGVVEIHIKPYEDIFYDIWFRKFRHQDLSQMKIENVQCGNLGFTYPSMTATENFQNVVFHFLKHYIVGSANIRQIMDILLYYINNKDRIDISSFLNIIQHTGYSKIFEMIFCVGIQYFKMDQMLFTGIKTLRIPDELVQRFIDDIRISSDIKIEDTEFERYWLIYSRIKFYNNSKRMYNIYMLRWRIPRILQILFPNKDYLRNEYKKSLLVSWLKYIFVYIRTLSKQENKADYVLLFAKNNDLKNTIIKDRVKLFEDLSILKKNETNI